MSANIFTTFETVLLQEPSRIIATLEAGREISRQQLLDWSAQIAQLFHVSGLEPGDRVTVQIDKSIEGVALYLACLRAGLVYHPLNTAYQPGELRYFIDNAEPAAVVFSGPYQENLQAIAEDAGISLCWRLDGDGSGSLMQQAGKQSLDFDTVARAPDDLAALLYSSGTTGRPKGIMLSHGNMAASAHALHKAWAFTRDDVLLHMLPVFHVHGLFVAIHCVLMSGARMIFLPKFTPELALRYLPQSTVMMGVPTYYSRLLDSEFNKSFCTNMRVFISGSAPLLLETFQAFEQRTGMRILERYGMTETNMNSSNPLNGERRAGTVGPALPGTEIRVVDARGVAVAAGEVGAIQVRGANVFSGYWRLPAKTAEDFTADGFFNTGDQGTLSSDGYLSIVGRAKDMVISGGLNVYPKEIELLIDEQPGVEESAVIGVPHPDFGEAVVAVIVGDADLDQLHATLKRELANFKQPKKLIAVDSLPRNTMGKVQKAMLRQRYGDLFKG